MTPKPASSKIAVLAQICKLIPATLVARLAAEHGVDKKARTFSVFSHIVALLLAQLTRASSLNDVCDNARIHQAKLGALDIVRRPAAMACPMPTRSAPARWPRRCSGPHWSI